MTRGDVTSFVRVSRDAPRMDKPLEPGDERHCPHCHGWHMVAERHTERTEYTRRMLYFPADRAITTLGRSASEPAPDSALHRVPLTIAHVDEGQLVRPRRFRTRSIEKPFR